MPFLIRSACLTGYVELAHSLGLDPFRLLKEVSLDRSCLFEPDLKIPVDAANRLLEISTRAARIEDFGLRLAEARRLISGLRPPILDEQGVVAALEYLVNEARQQIPEIIFVNRAAFTRLAAPLEVALFRITQEALTNIRKHSGAKSARVELLQHGDRVRLVIRDFGCGFDHKTVHEERFGLQGIRQRARLLGTAATIDSAPGKGTTVVVDFPIVVDTDSTASCEE
jgi:signal transduction histidine kinase